MDTNGLGLQDTVGIEGMDVGLQACFAIFPTGFVAFFHNVCIFKQKRVEHSSYFEQAWSLTLLNPNISLVVTDNSNSSSQNIANNRLVILV